jgi:hypothetical protein
VSRVDRGLLLDAGVNSIRLPADSGTQSVWTHEVKMNYPGVAGHGGHLSRTDRRLDTGRQPRHIHRVIRRAFESAERHVDADCVTSWGPVSACGHQEIYRREIAKGEDIMP